MKRIQTICFSLLLIFLNTSCSAPTPAETVEAGASEVPEASPTLFSVYPYPAPVTPTLFDYTKEEGYPIPESTPFFENLPDLLVIPTPGAETGVVVGQLLTPGPGGEPYYSTLYLARTIFADEEDMPPIIAFSEAEDPVSTQDKTGRFLFTDVPPGEYALALWSPVSSTILQEPDTEEYLVFEVKAGEVTDLGIIAIP